MMTLTRFPRKTSVLPDPWNQGYGGSLVQPSRQRIIGQAGQHLFRQARYVFDTNHWQP